MCRRGASKNCWAANGSMSTASDFSGITPDRSPAFPAARQIFKGHYPDLHGVTQTDGIGKTSADSRMRWLRSGEVPTLGNWLRAAG